MIGNLLTAFLHHNRMVNAHSGSAVGREKESPPLTLSLSLSLFTLEIRSIILYPSSPSRLTMTHLAKKRDEKRKKEKNNQTECMRACFVRLHDAVTGITSHPNRHAYQAFTSSCSNCARAQCTPLPASLPLSHALFPHIHRVRELAATHTHTHRMKESDIYFQIQVLPSNLLSGKNNNIINQ